MTIFSLKKKTLVLTGDFLMSNHDSRQISRTLLIIPAIPKSAVKGMFYITFFFFES